MTRLLILSLLLLAGVLSPVAGRAQALPDNSLDRIVAVVEEDVILRSELDMSIRSIVAQYADRRTQLPPADILERQVLERLVLLRLQLQRAESAGIRVGDAEVDQTIRRIAEQNRMSVEQLRMQLVRDGMDFPDYRRILREEMIAQRLRQSVIQSRVNVSDTEIDILLASNSLKRGQVRSAVLLVAVPEGASNDQIETARRKIEGIRDLVARGEMDFHAATIRYSDAPNALEGGDTGWRTFDEMPPMYANLLQGMKVGELSQPVRTPNGYTLVQLTDMRDEEQETVTEYKARDLLIRKTELVDSAEALRRIQDLRAQILAGADFAEIAREHSQDDMTRNNGGDMGWFQPYAWGSAVGDTLLRLEDGEISEPFESDIGWHVIQRLETRQQDVTDEVVRNRARETIAKRKAEEEYERFLRNLREESYVETRLRG